MSIQAASVLNPGDLVQLDLDIDAEGVWDGLPWDESPHGTVGIVLKRSTECTPDEEGPYYQLLMADGTVMDWSRASLILVQEAKAE